MIPVTLPNAPGNYVHQVRQPGQNFLAAHPHPTADDWRRRNYWRHIHTHLYTQVRGICMYSSSFTPRRPGPLDHTSIDHFVPKSQGNHSQAYEWSNFRLCRSRLNHRKADFSDVLDPCTLQQGWFRISFNTFLISPDAALPLVAQTQVVDTVRRLGLNDDDAYVNERARVVYGYADGTVPFNDVSERYPFIASEMTAQNFDANHLPRFREALANPRVRAPLMRQGLL